MAGAENQYGRFLLWECWEQNNTDTHIHTLKQIQTHGYAGMQSTQDALSPQGQTTPVELHFGGG